MKVCVEDVEVCEEEVEVSEEEVEVSIPWENVSILMSMILGEENLKLHKDFNPMI